MGKKAALACRRLPQVSFPNFEKKIYDTFNLKKKFYCQHREGWIGIVYRFFNFICLYACSENWFWQFEI